MTLVHPRSPAPARRNYWPAFVAAKEGGLAFPGSPELYWTFDEFLRQGTLFYLSKGQQISIELPVADRQF